MSVYLSSYLETLSDLFSRSDVSDIWINKPGEVWTETLSGVIERLERPSLTGERLSRLSRQVAAYSSQGISREHPLLSSHLPDGTRVQIIAPPATRRYAALAFRRHVMSRRDLSEYALDGSFADDLLSGQSDASRRNDDLRLMAASGRYEELLREAVKRRRTVLISGGTATGKTTFMNALLAEIPQHERLILIEDTPELQVSHPNWIGLLAARSELGEARINANDLLAASLRMRPDRIIVGELRGSEAFTFLRTINTGHPGSMTTIHADSPDRAVEQLTLLVLQSGMGLSRSDIQDYVRSTIDVFVQLERGLGGRRISQIMISDVPSQLTQ